MKQLKFLGLKFLRGCSLLIGLSILTFIMMYNSPIDPISAYIGGDVSITTEQREALEEYWGLNNPPQEQYLTWLKNFASGDMGTSKIYRRPVSNIISEKFTASFVLMGISWILSGVIGFCLGILAAVKKGKPLDKIIKCLSYIQASVPTFWLGLMLLIIFSVWLRWFPIGISVPIGVMSSEVTLWNHIHHMILPIITLSVLGIANVTLHTREKMIDVLNSEYILFAKARGERSWEIIKNHGIRNVALPAITLHFAYFGELFGGSVLAEQVFSYPGLGSTLTEAGLKSDLPLLMGIVVVSAVFVFTGNMIADILNAIINPRLKEGNSLD
ncbi:MULTISPECIES: ABC transporter permease [Clostridium]|mgnify:CR=1 FL=1|uniref:Peptide/nickel transport system permease protein n=1 Tax=Clostridium cadaveris TaxID=1529 RepID=A0A1I2K4V0_9CLOT|nr:ABC transporter permease [Clostridium cadaveris]MDU4950943.1 ABC transporter permease [Clostridium sp.]MDM8313484.1 ABC transporter permease [Clostridium cadaveris]MDY4949113.1 ABC transporter permease [Clostridium cadaveris]NME63308.1 ABC transporter permease [Clostridium cadaveris]NWK11434.1 ABC transporter permease [Clostridium cadaveris]